MSSPKTEKNNCKFFVHRKKRHCRMIPKNGEEFCAEHQKVTIETNDKSAAENDKIRIVCPLDNKHTCYAHKLNKHLKICNARKGVQEPYIEEGINSGTFLDNDPQETFKFLSTFSPEQILTTIAKVKKVFDHHINGKITELMLNHECVLEEMKKPEYGIKTKKHLTQVSSILGLMQNYNMLKPKSCYIEFGAGRGQLSFWISKAVGEHMEDIKLLLVERASPKHKKDNKLDKSEERVQRIRADIADLVLDKVDQINSSQNIYGLTKHLCGVATDLAMRCLTNASSNKSKISGMVMTFCCHHKCLWSSFTGKDFFEENGLDVTDFEIIRGMASWATCGNGFSRERRCNDIPGEEKDALLQRDNELDLTRKEKEEIGKKCKNIINYGRLLFLEKQDFKCSLHYYVPSNITPENVCIVAQKI